MSIPGAGGGTATTIELTASGTVTSGSSTVFSASDGAALTQLIADLVASGGTLTTSGTLSGSGVQIVVTQASQSNGSGTVTATVTYN
ncbi:MAG: hypothetical protein PSV24_09255 [Rhodoferax sp.]|nr:hypothetical protein [Rhodoferax sp.]